MKNNQVPFDRLRKILRDLGFTETAIAGPYLYFEHPPSDTILVYHNYRPTEEVSWADEVKTRKFLDLKGLLEADDFDALLHKEPV
jgi:hypothetical protein